MLNGREITVVGAGVGGLTSAIALARRGARVRLLEQSPDISEVGAGLQITPNGIAVLDALGLADPIRAIGRAASAVELRDFRQGALVARMDLVRHGPGRPWLLLHRADLVALLADAARGEGVEILLDHPVAEISETGAGARIRLCGGEVLETALVVAADGLHSRLRPVLNGTSEPFFTGQVAWRALIHSPDRQRHHVEVHMGPGRHVVTYPLRNGDMINVVAVEEREQWISEGWNHPGDPAQLRRAFAAFSAPVQALLSKAESVNVWGLFRHPVAENWHGRHCVLIGDAAHPTLPFLAQGANMALEDAWVLADCLSKLPAQQALADYQLRRHRRVSRVIEAANANARNYHLRSPVMRMAAHAALRAASRTMPGSLLGRFRWVHDFDVTQEM